MRLHWAGGAAVVLALALAGRGGAEQFVRLTPDWAQKNPGRLEMSRGAAFNGSSGFTFRLVTNQPRKFEVTTRLFRRTAEGEQPIIETPADFGVGGSVTWQTAVWPVNNMHIRFTVVESEPLRKEGRTTGFRPLREYRLDLDDFLDRQIKLSPVDFEAVRRESLEQ